MDSPAPATRLRGRLLGRNTSHRGPYQRTTLRSIRSPKRFSPLRTHIETGDAHGQPGLLPRADSTVVPGTADRRNHGLRYLGVVRPPPCGYCGRRPVHADALGHHGSGEGLRLPATRKQSVRGHQALPMARTGALLLCRGSTPAWVGAEATRTALSDMGGNHPTPSTVSMTRRSPTRNHPCRRSRLFSAE